MVSTTAKYMQGKAKVYNQQQICACLSVMLLLFILLFLRHSAALSQTTCLTALWCPPHTIVTALHIVLLWCSRMLATARNFVSSVRLTLFLCHHSVEVSLVCAYSLSFLWCAQSDRRYDVLEPKPEERNELLHNYMVDLEKRGPPPPPTASEPTDRLNRRRWRLPLSFTMLVLFLFIYLHLCRAAFRCLSLTSSFVFSMQSAASLFVFFFPSSQHTFRVHSF